MNSSKSDVIVIGAGLTGLTIAYLLRKSNISIQIIEGRNEVGGRVKTIRKDGYAPLELGATWFGKRHSEVNKLLNDLSIDKFEQQLGKGAIYEPLSTSPPQLVTLPQNEEETSFRVKDGTSSIIQQLQNSLGSKQAITTNQRVTSIQKDEGGLLVKTDTATYTASIVVSTLPPNLLEKTVKIIPNLPTDISKVMQETHTWMGESIKIGLFFKRPFWRESNLSGTIFSNVGPIPEMYDHSDYEDTRHALKGFLNGSYFSLSKSERLNLALGQLRKYYGNIVDGYISYEEKVWRNDSFTYHPYESDVFPHQHNGHPIFQKPLIDDNFYIAGSETSPHFPGYMEGAIRSAQCTAKSLKDRFH